jgi:hypothetical protein
MRCTLDDTKGASAYCFMQLVSADHGVCVLEFFRFSIWREARCGQEIELFADRSIVEFVFLGISPQCSAPSLIYHLHYYLYNLARRISLLVRACVLALRKKTKTANTGKLGLFTCYVLPPIHF